MNNFFFAVVEEYKSNDLSPAHAVIAGVWGPGTAEQCLQQANVYHQKLTGIPLDDEEISWLKESGFLTIDQAYWDSIKSEKPKLPWNHTLKVDQFHEFTGAEG